MNSANPTSRRRRLPRTLVSFLLLLLLLSAHALQADDIDIYDPKLCTAPQRIRFIFIVDNSGSMNTQEFTNSKATITAAANYIIRENPVAQVAIVQYGTETQGRSTPNHTYTVSVPFTRNLGLINRFTRHYCNGSNQSCQDHLPGSLASMRLSGAYNPGGTLDIQDATSVQLFIFTDAQFASGRYSYLSNSGDYLDTRAYRGYEEYFALREGRVMPNGVKAQISLLYSGVAPPSQIASIATVGGSYTQAVESYPDDPDESGKGPRRLEVGSLAVTDVAKSLALVDNVFEEVPRDIPVAPPAPSVSASTYQQTTKDNELFYTLFRGTNTARWFGNVKKYRFSNSGTVLDKRGKAAINTGAGTFKKTSVSFWSNSPDGETVEQGGFSGLLGTNRPWLSDVDGRVQRINRANQLSLSSLGRNTSSAQRNLIYQFFRGIDSIDINEDGQRNNQAHKLNAETIHGTALPITYADGRKVVFTTTNLGGLHAIDGDTGQELWHYTAREFLPLARTFLFDHKDEDISKLYGFDGAIVPWQRKENGKDKVTLFLTQRRGGHGLYAFDVSEPRNPDRVRLLWRSNGDSWASGQSWYAPKLVKINTQCSADRCQLQNALLVGGGYDTEYDNDSLSRGDQRGRSIALLDPENGQVLWSAGPRDNRPTEVVDVEHSIIQTPAAIDTNGDKAIDTLFSVDIQGNVWRYDLTRHPKNIDDLLQSSGKIADLSNSSVHTRFLQAIDVAQLDAASLDVNLDVGQFFALSIGSGDMTRPKKVTGPRDNFFVLFDPNVHSAPEDYRYVKPSSSSRTSQLITASVLRDVDQARAAVSRYGLFQRLEQGEKVSSSSLSRGGRVVYASYVPKRNPQSCDDEQGDARVRGLNLNSQTNLFGSTAEVTSNTPYFALPQRGFVNQLSTIDYGKGEFLLAGAYTTQVEDIFGEIKGIRHFERRGWFEQR